MDVTTLDQAIVFFYCILCGVAVGIVFDVFRVLRKLSRPRVLTVSIQDIVYWVIVSVAFFGILLFANNGELRWYEFLGVFSGATIYFLFFSHFVTAATLGIIRFLARIIIYLYNLIAYPIKYIYKLFQKPIYFALFRIKRFGRAFIGYFHQKRNEFKKNIRKIKLISKKT